MIMVIMEVYRMENHLPLMNTQHMITHHQLATTNATDTDLSHSLCTHSQPNLVGVFFGENGPNRLNQQL